MFTEIDSAILTAENLGDAYRALQLPSMPDGTTQCRVIISRELIKFHPTITKAQRVDIASQVIAQWIADYNA